jgi:hypothetical protein
VEYGHCRSNEDSNKADRTIAPTGAASVTGTASVTAAASVTATTSPAAEGGDGHTVAREPAWAC